MDEPGVRSTRGRGREGLVKRGEGHGVRAGTIDILASFHPTPLYKEGSGRPGRIEPGEGEGIPRD